MKKILWFIPVFILFSFCSSSKAIQFKLNSSQNLKGHLVKPEGNGPFPAVVIMHGCGGMHQNYFEWAEKLKKWGYVSFIVDSLSPRGVYRVCGKGKKPNPLDRVQDAFAAKRYLLKLPFIKKDKIALLGFSHGGITSIISSLKLEKLKIKNPFSVVIAFYPYCFNIKENQQLNNPLMILIGQADDWTPAHLCTVYKNKLAKNKDFILKIYPDAHHGFDWEGVDVKSNGHVIREDPDAFTDSQKMVKMFLSKYLQ